MFHGVLNKHMILLGQIVLWLGYFMAVTLCYRKCYTNDNSHKIAKPKDYLSEKDHVFI